MKTFFRTPLIALALLTISASALAEFNFGLNYARYDFSFASVDAAHANLGYSFQVTDSISLIPEVRFGTGVGSSQDNLGINYEIDQFYGGGLRVQFDHHSGLYGFIAPSYAEYKIKVSAPGFSATVSSWEFAPEAGLGFSFTDNFGFEAFYQNIDSSDVIGAGLRFRF
jgi:hypothetical protein